MRYFCYDAYSNAVRPGAGADFTSYRLRKYGDHLEFKSSGFGGSQNRSVTRRMGPGSRRKTDRWGVNTFGAIRRVIVLRAGRGKNKKRK